MFSHYSHFLAYGSTDQQTLRELNSEYDGLVVPGTIAAYQSEGTRGFVLTLSAAARQPYAIDPRSPLFQYYNPNPKQSHLALASVLGFKSEIERDGLVPISSWDDIFCERVAESWISFNTAYTTIAPKQFEKYAKRLKRDVPAADATGPTWILAPYLMQTGDSSIARVNDLLWSNSQSAAKKEAHKLRRVIADVDCARLVRTASGLGHKQVVIWVDNLDEVDGGNLDLLTQYASAVQELVAIDITPFALYGGFFAVALGVVGLVGASHGVGFSEYRNHIELKSSGGAPARFYVQRIHRFIPVDLASTLWRQNPSLVESFYPSFRDRDPGEYTYHELMAHSVRARSNEIHRVTGLTLVDVADELEAQQTFFISRLKPLALSRAVRARAEQSVAHLRTWATAMRNS